MGGELVESWQIKQIDIYLDFEGKPEYGKAIFCIYYECVQALFQ